MGADLFIGNRQETGYRYFRDSYNPSNLLWRYDLSYWQDIPTLLDKEQNMSPQQAKTMLGWLDERQATFEASLTPERLEADKGENESLDEVRQYFTKKDAELRAFLSHAIAEDKPIYCSI